MITTEDKIGPAQVLSTTYFMKQELPFTVSLFDKTHYLDISVFYEETDDDKELIGVKINENTRYDYGKGVDVGEVTHTIIGDWFDDQFGIDHSKEEDAMIIENLDNVFEQVWEFFEERGLV